MIPPRQPSLWYHPTWLLLDQCPTTNQSANVALTLANVLNFHYRLRQLTVKPPPMALAWGRCGGDLMMIWTTCCQFGRLLYRCCCFCLSSCSPWNFVFALPAATPFGTLFHRGWDSETTKQPFLKTDGIHWGQYVTMIAVPNDFNLLNSIKKVIITG